MLRGLHVVPSLARGTGALIRLLPLADVASCVVHVSGVRVVNWRDQAAA